MKVDRLARSTPHVWQLKQSSTTDLSIGGADLAAQALAAGLVDQCSVFLAPTAVGSGKPVLPVGVRLRLELLDHHRFCGGAVYLIKRCSRQEGDRSDFLNGYVDNGNGKNVSALGGVGPSA